MQPDAVDDDFKHLGQLLWHYRQALTEVEYLLDVQDLLVTAGRERWLSRAADHLRGAVDGLAALDAERSEVVRRVAAGLAVSPTTTLGGLASIAPDPWSEILADHVAWFNLQLQVVGDAVARTRSSVEGGLDHISDLLRTLAGAADSGYDAGGRRVAVPAATSLLFDDRA